MDLSIFLLEGDQWIPAPRKINPKYEELGFQWLRATAKHVRTIDKAGDVYQKWGDILLDSGKTTGAIQTWQGLLEAYPTYKGYDAVENKIKEALK